MASPGMGTFILPTEPVFNVQVCPNMGPMVAPPPYSQPPPLQFMPPPVRQPGCPPGLEYLAQLDQLAIHQQLGLLEAVSGWETANNYIVKNSLGQQVFVAKEASSFFGLHLTGARRPFTINLYDNMGQLIVKLIRPLRCNLCCLPCCLQQLEVQCPPGNTIGYLKQNWHPFLPRFTILNDRKEPQLKIKGPLCNCSCISDIVFQVMSLDETAKVGQISKHWAGFVQDYTTNIDNFGISFEQDLDIKLKAMLMGACFLIDFMYFEEKSSRR